MGTSRSTGTAPQVAPSAGGRWALGVRPLVVVLAIALLSAACGDEGADQSVPLPPSNEADVQFLQSLLTLEGQAEGAAAASQGRFEHKEALGLLEAVLEDRRSQLRHVRNLLRFIGAKPGAPPRTAPVATTDGPDALRLFLEALVRADQETLELADREVANGVFPDAKALAETLRRTRHSEMTTALRLLAELP